MPTCPGCGFEAEPGRDVCPVCGRGLASGTETAATAGPSGGSGTPGPDTAIPWEDPVARFPGNLVRTWTESLFRPDAFFRRVTLEASLFRPVLYLLLVSIAGAFLTLLAAAAGLQRPFLEGMVGSGEAQLIRFFAAPFSALLGLLAGTLVVHLFVRLVVDEARRIGATARILCYASGPGVFAFLGGTGGIPGALASLVVLVWTLILQAAGVREIHRTSALQAILVVLGPVFLLVLLVVLLAVILVLAGPELPELWPPGT